jgi:histidinol-phosphate aminotransferase
MAWYDDLLRPELASIKAYRPAAARSDAVRLDANESPWGLGVEAQRHLADALAHVPMHRYPDVRATRVRELVAEASGAHPDQIVLGVGSDDVIAVTLLALGRARAGRPRAAFAFPEPSFVMFRVNSLVQGADPVGVPLDDAWDLDVDAFDRALRAHAPNVLFLPSPNNPTGNLFADDRIEQVIEFARATGTLVILDEAYGRFSGRSYRALRESHEHVAQLQTLSKIGFAAARVGWGIFSRELASEIDKARQPYNLNALSQRAAEIAFTELRVEMDAAVARIVSERARVEARLATFRGCTFVPSTSNFVWLDVGRDAGDVYQQLFDRGIVVRSFHASGGRLATRMRVTIGTPDENDRFLDALAQIVG